MTRILIAAVLGAVVLFVWGMISWTVLPWHEWTMHGLPNDGEMAAAMKATVPESGAYIFPPMPTDTSDQAAMELCKQRHAAGPVGFMIFHRDGRPFMPGTMFAYGGAIVFVTSLCIAWLVHLAAGHARDYLQRLGVAVLAGVIVALHSDVMLWNWMDYPVNFTLVSAADHLVGIALAGVVIAAIVKSDAKAAA